MASTYLTKTFSSEGNRKVWTFSAWIKRSELGTKEIFWSGSASNNYARIGFEGNDSIKIFEVRSGSTSWEIETNAKFRDTNGWYHLVITSNTLSGTSSERTKIMVNNVEQTLSTNSQIPQNDQSTINGGSPHKIGSGYSAGFFDGSMSHIHFTDGTVYAPTAFGEYDANGVWKIKTDVSVTYGTNGFFILKDGNSVTDQSGNSNNFTVGGGTLTNTEDSPSTVFATLDALQYKTSALTYSNGNTTVSFPGAWIFALSQWGVSSGKWYWEAKCNSGNNANSFYGICAEMVPTGNGFYNNSQHGAILYKVGSGETFIDATSNSSGYSPSIDNTDIVGLALDLDSGTKTLKIYKNGTLLSSNGTINLSSYYNDTLVFPCFTGNSSSASCSFNVNFGNGYFGTTAVSSAGTNASGIGIFEYDVPTGYTSLSTKGLNL